MSDLRSRLYWNLKQEEPEKRRQQQTAVYLTDELKKRLRRYLRDREDEGAKISRTRLICEAVDAWLRERGY